VLEQISGQPPAFSWSEFDSPDSSQVPLALAKVDEVYQAAVAHFYLNNCSYKEISAILNVPLGTVKSRIARGIAQLRDIFAEDQSCESSVNRW
jgi:RNA polymerase sigma-70 factor (ECF subfamily)